MNFKCFLDYIKSRDCSNENVIGFKKDKDGSFRCSYDQPNKLNKHPWNLQKLKKYW